MHERELFESGTQLFRHSRQKNYLYLLYYSITLHALTVSDSFSVNMGDKEKFLDKSNYKLSSFLILYLIPHGK